MVFSQCLFDFGENTEMDSVISVGYLSAEMFTIYFSSLYGIDVHHCLVM